MPSSLSSDSLCSPTAFNPITPESNHGHSPESTLIDSPQSPQKEYETPDNRAEDTESEPPKKKSKAGRKPLYKTAQERRDRNRRAQLAFRARRSDYLARLEETCRSLENVVVELQESNRTANDALIRERNRVKYLERLLQNSLTSFNLQHSVPNLFNASSIPADNGGVPPLVEQQGVSAYPLLQDLSLITLDQQFPQSSVQHNMYNSYLSQTFLGMLPHTPF